MKIGLYGILGVYNFGCEAIVRGATSFIRAKYPDAEIIYFTYNYDYDSKVLSDLDILVEPIIINRSIPNRIYNRLSISLGLNNRKLMFDYKRIIDKVDLVVSIGGDIYTIPKCLREKKKYPYYNSLVDFCNKAIGSGKKVIVYGASVGPFGEYKKAVNYYKRNMEKYDLIICRETESIGYLNSIGINNCVFFPDPAFQVKTTEEVQDSQDYIGVNLSPLSIREIYGDLNEDCIKRVADILDELHEKSGQDLLFIPHVISKDKNDNDYLFLNTVKEHMQHNNHVRFANTDGGFIGIKKQLHSCRIVISARMHCAINAIVEGVPTIFLAYSQKSVGMCKYVYCSDKWLIDIQNINNYLIPKALEMINVRDDVSQYLDGRNIEIDNYYSHNIKTINF